MNNDGPSTVGPPAGFRNLPDSECLAFLQSENLGRLGLTASALPVVIPVRYRLAGRSAVFAVAAGATLGSPRHNVIACLEIDGIDPATGAGWMVHAIGRLREITDSSTIVFDDGRPFQASGLTSTGRVAAIDIELLSGTTSKSA